MRPLTIDMGQSRDLLNDAIWLKVVNKELLKALEDFVECMEVYKDDFLPKSDHEAFWLFLNQAKETIKKANN